MVAILTSSATDVLSHIAIRARAQNVLLATCFERAQFDDLQEQASSQVSLSVDPKGNVVMAPAPEVDRAEANGAAPAQAKELSLVKPRLSRSGPWVLAESQFGEKLVGGKSGNLAVLRSKLGSLPGTAVPPSLALPFGTFERVLEAKCNSGTLKQLTALAEALVGGNGRGARLEMIVCTEAGSYSSVNIRCVHAFVAIGRPTSSATCSVASLPEQAKTAPGEGIPEELAAVRQLIGDSLLPPPGFREELACKVEEEGLLDAAALTDDTFGHLWRALCQVWSSKWTDRAWLSRRAVGIPDDNLFMAVLLQPIVPADYAFVLHSADPITGERGCVHGELVLGMGEALVGNAPGAALTFRAHGGEVELLSLPSKRVGLYPDSALPLLIARSDSNGEDLEAFAGAGLYESIPLSPLQPRALDYSNERLLWDADFQRNLLRRLAVLAAGVESSFGGQPQDIEGVLVGDALFVVQTRPQVIREA